jgi:hypothetical protein
MKWKNWMRYTLRDEAGEMGSGDTGGGTVAPETTASGMDPAELAAAVDSISEGLGFKSNDDDTDPPDGEAAETAKPEPTDKPVDDKTTATPTGNKPAPLTDINVPPGSWRDTAKSTWATIPEAARQEILKRENDMFDGIAQYKDNAIVGKTVLNTIEPFIPMMKQYNVNPAQHIGNLMRTHHDLIVASPEVRAQQLIEIGRQYGVPLTIAGARQATASDDEPGSYVDPEVQRLTAEFQALKSNQAQINSTFQAQKTAEVERMIADFAAKPENKHFDLVYAEMSALIGKGLAKDLPDAYQKAIRLNPQAWALESQRLQTEAAEKAKKEVLEKAAQVKRSTAANVNSKARDGSRATTLGSMEDTMKAAYEKAVGK